MPGTLSFKKIRFAKDTMEDLKTHSGLVIRIGAVEERIEYITIN